MKQLFFVLFLFLFGFTCFAQDPASLPDISSKKDSTNGDPDLLQIDEDALNMEVMKRTRIYVKDFEGEDVPAFAKIVAGKLIEDKLKENGFSNIENLQDSNTSLESIAKKEKSGIFITGILAQSGEGYTAEIMQLDASNDQIARYEKIKSDDLAGLSTVMDVPVTGLLTYMNSYVDDQVVKAIDRIKAGEPPFPEEDIVEIPQKTIVGEPAETEPEESTAETELPPPPAESEEINTSLFLYGSASLLANIGNSAAMICNSARTISGFYKTLSEDTGNSAYHQKHDDCKSCANAARYVSYGAIGSSLAINSIAPFISDRQITTAGRSFFSLGMLLESFSQCTYMISAASLLNTYSTWGKSLLATDEEAELRKEYKEYNTAYLNFMITGLSTSIASSLVSSSGFLIKKTDSGRPLFSSRLQKSLYIGGRTFMGSAGIFSTIAAKAGTDAYSAYYKYLSTSTDSRYDDYKEKYDTYKTWTILSYTALISGTILTMTAIWLPDQFSTGGEETPILDALSLQVVPGGITFNLRI